MEKKSSVADKTLIKDIGFCDFGNGANASSVDVKDGRIVRVRPLQFSDRYKPEDLKSWYLEKDGKRFDPGFKTLLPPFSLAYKQRTYSKNRIPYPLKRVDFDPKGERNIQNRGKSKYVRISWDEALDIVADEIKRIHDTYGPNSIYCQGEGHGETKYYPGGHGCMIMMLNECGGCTIQARQPDSWEGWYWGAKHIWGQDPLGQQLHTNGAFRDITENGDAVFFWGADPETTPWGWGGQITSRMCYWLNDIGVKSVFICPDLNYAAAVHADKWIAPLPNTDAALQLAIAYVWMTEGTYDREYIDTHAVGFDWFEYHVMGGDDGIPKTPEWAAEKCGVPAYTIKALARYWATHNCSIAHCNGGGFIRGCFAHEPARLEVALLGMQAVGHPGRHQFKFIEWQLFGYTTMSPVPRFAAYPNLRPLYNGWTMELGESFIAKTKLHRALKDGKSDWWGHVLCTYPREDQFFKYGFPVEGSERIHMIWSDAPCWSTCWNGGNDWQECLIDDNIEFVLVQHPWMENDCVFADIILPSNTMMESYDLNYDDLNGQHALMYYSDKAIDPIGESLTDHQIVCDIAKRLESKFGGVYEGLFERYNGPLTREEEFVETMKTCGVEEVESMTLEEFKEKQFVAIDVLDGWETEPAGMIGFYEDPEANPINTPTGKIEYYSTALAEGFPDDQIRGPYPKWVEEGDGHQERIHSERAKLYPYLLVTNHPRWRVHANHDDMSWLREIETCKVKGPDGYLYEPIWVNPVDAEKEGLKHGDIAKLFNERGAVLGGVRVSERIAPGALYQDHGARVDSVVIGLGDGLDRGGANNLICPSETTSKHAAGEVTNGFLVGIEKVDVFELAEQYPEAFGRDYDPGCGLILDAYIVKEGEDD